MMTQDKHDIEDYLRYKGVATPNRRSGWVKMKCPWHDDSTASAAVNYDANRFKCHACGVAGDVYDLIQLDKGGTLSEAIEFASTISSTSDHPVRKPYRGGRGVSINAGSLGRRGSHVSSGSGRRSASGS